MVDPNGAVHFYNNELSKLRYIPMADSDFWKPGAACARGQGSLQAGLSSDERR